MYVCQASNAYGTAVSRAANLTLFFVQSPGSVTPIVRSLQRGSYVKLDGGRLNAVPQLPISWAHAPDPVNFNTSMEILPILIFYDELGSAHIPFYDADVYTTYTDSIGRVATAAYFRQTFSTTAGTAITGASYQLLTSSGCYIPPSLCQPQYQTTTLNMVRE